MALGLKPLFGGRKAASQQGEGHARSMPEDDFIATSLAKSLSEMTDQATLNGDSKACLDQVGRFLDTLNAQNGINVTIRRMEEINSNNSMFLVLDLSAVGLNRKIKEMPFHLKLTGEDKKNLSVYCHGYRVRIGNDKAVKSALANGDECNFDSVEGREAVLEHIAGRIMAEKLRQKFQDRAKGYVIQRQQSHEHIRNTKKGVVKAHSF